MATRERHCDGAVADEYGAGKRRSGLRRTTYRSFRTRVSGSFDRDDRPKLEHERWLRPSAAGSVGHRSASRRRSARDRQRRRHGLLISSFSLSISPSAFCSLAVIVGHHSCSSARVVPRDDRFPDSRDGAALLLEAGAGVVSPRCFNGRVSLRAEARYVHDNREGGHGEPRRCWASKFRWVAPCASSSRCRSRRLSNASSSRKSSGRQRMPTAMASTTARSLT